MSVDSAPSIASPEPSGEASDDLAKVRANMRAHLVAFMSKRPARRHDVVVEQRRGRQR